MQVFDIATKLIDPKTNIWVVHPGRNRRFYSRFLQSNTVFLELPALNAGRKTFDEIGRSRQHVRMSLEHIRRYSSSDVSSRPSKNPANYSDQAGDGQFNTWVGNARKLYGTAKVGDLVVVPGKGAYAPVLFGEIATPFNPSDTIRVEQFNFADIQTRQVKWISTNHYRRDLPPHLDIHLSKPPAIRSVSRGKGNGDGFFEYAYPSYILGDVSVAQIYGPRYSGKNPLDTYPATRLIAYLVSAYAALEKGKDGELSRLGIDQVIEQYYDPTLIESFTQNFNSPGGFGVRAKTPLLAMIVTLGVTIAVGGFDPMSLLSGIVVENSAAGGPDQVGDQAGEKVKYLMNALGADRVREMQEIGDEAKKTIGLKTPVRAK